MTLDLTPARRPAVVLVEDDVDVAFMLERRLQRSGFDVRTAPTVADARVLFGAGDWDIAVLDRNLPDGDGLDLCSELRNRREHGYLVLLTGDDSEQSKLAGFQKGADDYITKPFSLDELVARLRAGARIVALQKALLESNRHLEELSTSDSLTNLQNRRGFENDFSTLFERARRYQRPLSLAVIDIDHFKSINDRFGHDAGDLVLRAIAQILESSTRQSDVIARVGGEEFAVMMPETSLFEATQALEKLRASVASSTITLGGVSHRVTVSIGAATVPHSEVDTPAQFYRLADQALYRAKAAGRNCVSVERRRHRFTLREVAPPPAVACNS